MRVEQCVRTFVWREEDEQVFDPALFQRPGNMVHRRLGDIRAQDHRQDIHRNIWEGKKSRMMNVSNNDNNDLYRF